MKGWGINNRTLYRRAMSIQHRMERIEKTERPTKEKTLRARFGEREFHGDEVLSVKGLGKALRRADAVFGRRICRSRAANASRCWATTARGNPPSSEAPAGRGGRRRARCASAPRSNGRICRRSSTSTTRNGRFYDTMLYEKNCTAQTARDRLGAYPVRGRGRVQDRFDPLRRRAVAGCGCVC